MAKKISIGGAVSSAINSKDFNLHEYKKSNNLVTNTKFKPQTYIPISEAFTEAISVEGIPTGQLTILRGHSDSGKAQPLFAKVLTPNGWTTIGQIEVGDEIIGSDGKSQRVVGVFPQGIRDVYKVSTSDGGSVLCDGEHLWSVNSYKRRHHRSGKRDVNGKRAYSPDMTYITMKTIDMLDNVKCGKGRYITNNYMLPVLSPVQFTGVGELPINPYTLGVLLGDGSISDTVTISTHDEDIFPYLQEDEHFGSISKYDRPDDRYIFVIRMKSTIKPELDKLGLLNTKSYSKFIPKEYIYNSSVDDRLSLLQGLLDTDGYINKNGSIEYTTVSEKLASDIRDLTLSLGGFTVIRSKIPTYTSDGEKKNGRLAYTITIRLPQYFNPFRLKRRMERLTVVRKPMFRYISNIEYYGKEECVCIKVSNDDCLYVTDDFILTHNTTALLETAISCQKNGILPVFIITEMKWSWEHAISMGLEVTEHCDEDGVLFYDGFFIYADRSSLNTIEDVAAFINNRLKEQREGKLPYSLCFLWDSIGSIPCKLSVESNNNNNEWNAGAISAQFKNHVNQQIILSRKEGYPYINTLVCTNKIWVQKGTSYGEQPKLKNSGGESMFSDAALVITFGNVTSSGSSKIKAVKNGREVEFAKRIKISVDKNHITGITTTGRVVATSHGFIRDEKKDIDRYKKEYSSSWAKQLGSAEFDIVEEEYSTDDE